MSSKRRTSPSPTVVFDYGGVLSAGHDPIDDLHDVLGGDRDALERAVWEHRLGHDSGELDAPAYWGRIAADLGIENLTDSAAEELQDLDNRYFLRMDPAARALIHDLARNRVRLALLSNASASFGQAVRRADWFEAFSFAVISAEEHVVKPDREIYDILLDALAHETGGVSVPKAVVFFDDREANVEAARALGIDAHLWPRNGDDHGDGARHGADIAREILTARGIPLD
ncbi:HAD-IA family hydrolase [Brachybacterium timonense]|uniref:HAD-IA family hydrolase n=1 Tax=Brachybacterium timonense TaxID=2050896 RepID=UPI000D0AFE52|nr:HAD-IA family hydrolase [Brachybacterium timonense]